MRRTHASRLATTLLTGVIALTAALNAGAAPDSIETVLSPDGRIEVALELTAGVPAYSVTRDGRPVIQPSTLGFRFKDHPPLTGGFVVDEVERSAIDETWEPVWGSDSDVANHCNELKVHLRQPKELGRVMTVVFRVFDDGVGFRYVIPEQQWLGAFDIVSEETTFRFAGDHTAWWIPDDYDSYEHLFRETRLSAVEGANTPVTMATSDGLYLSVHEANLTDYAGMTLVPEGGVPNALRADLVPWPDGIKVVGRTPLTTPWRTVQIGDRPGDLVESHLIQNLNEPCVIEDTSWIRPMKYVGHLVGHAHRQGDLARGSDPRRDDREREALHRLRGRPRHRRSSHRGMEHRVEQVGRERRVRLRHALRRLRSPGRRELRAREGRRHHRPPRDGRGRGRLRDAASTRRSTSTRGSASDAVKTGYAGGIYPRGQHHHGQWMVDHYRKVVEKAAERRIMLDVHEPIKPTGISRTYPNMMTREGVRGMEYNAWSEGNPPEHTTILPFTRMLGGPLDYTPGIFDVMFDDYKPENRVHTTLAKQLALYVVLLSPLQMAADLPENYEGNPAFEFIERVPCTWDETRGTRRGDRRLRRHCETERRRVVSGSHHRREHARTQRVSGLPGGRNQVRGEDLPRFGGIGLEDEPDAGRRRHRRGRSDRLYDA